MVSIMLSNTADLWAEVQPESSRRLLIAALEAFSDHGFHAATTREIAERAGMSPAAVYVHYRAKVDLLYEITRVGHAAVLREVEEALTGAAADPIDRVHSYVEVFARWHADNYKPAKVIQYELKALRPEQYRAVVRTRKVFEDLLQGELSCGVDAGHFDISDLRGTTLAILSLCIDLARWHRPDEEHTAAQIGTLYADLVLRMVSHRTIEDPQRKLNADENKPSLREDYPS